MKVFVLSIALLIVSGAWAQSGVGGGGQSNVSGGGTAGAGGSSGNGYGNTGPIFNCVAGYGAVGDGSTNNATALTNCIAAANAYVQHPTNAQGLTDLPTVYFPSGTYNFTGGLNLTSPMIIRCDQGAVFNPTGTGNSNGHAIEIGPSTLTSSTYQTTYFIIGCSFTGGASLTSHAIFVNPFVLHPRIWDCKFFNFAGTGTSPVTWAIAFSTNVDDPDVERNYFFNNDNVVHNGVAVLVTNGFATDILRFVNNMMISAMPPGVTNTNGGHAANNAGIGLFADGRGSSIMNNEIDWYQPDVRLGSNANAAKIIGNVNWEASQTASTGVIQFGDAAGGNCPTCAVDDLLIDGMQSDMHNSAPGVTTNLLLQPTTATSLLTNANLLNITMYDLGASNPVVSLNNLTGQVGNIYSDIQSSTSHGAVSSTVLIQNTGTLLTDPFKGTTAEGDALAQPTNGLACANGGTNSTTCYLRVQNHATTSGTLVRVVMDTANDTQAFPNRGGFVQHTSGAGGGTKIGDWEALPVQVLTSPSAGALGLHTTFLNQGGIEDQGTTFGASGCSISAHVGGAAMGQYTSGTTGTCTVTITPGSTAAHGWTCWANDLTTVADVQHQTSASTATTAVISGTTVSGDVVNFGCTAY